MSLVNASISQQNKKQTDKQVFVSGSNGEKSMFMEAESATVANDWVYLIKLHCQYATAASLNGEFEESDTKKMRRMSSSGTGSTSALTRNNTMNSESERYKINHSHKLTFNI